MRNNKRIVSLEFETLWEDEITQYQVSTVSSAAKIIALLIPDISNTNAYALPLHKHTYTHMHITSTFVCMRMHLHVTCAVCVHDVNFTLALASINSAITAIISAVLLTLGILIFTESI